MYQKVTIVGNLGRAPEMRYMPDGTAVTNFSVATNRRWTDRNTGETTDETAWFRVSVWGKMAETANQHLVQGSKVLVDGRLKPDPNTGGPRTYTRLDGTVGASFEIAADQIRFLSSRAENEAATSSPSYGSANGDAPVVEDEIPF